MTNPLRLALLLMICLFSCNKEEGKEAVSDEAKIPFLSGAEKCFEKVADVEILGTSIKKMIAIARDGSSLADRVRDLGSARLNTIEEYRAIPEEEQSGLAENDFVCAADDILESVFAAEIDRIIASTSQETVAEELEGVRKLLMPIELDPAWNDYARPRLLERMKASPE